MSVLKFVLYLMIVSQIGFVNLLYAKEKPTSPNICIVSSTSDDEDRFGLFPWPDTVEAALIEKMEHSGVKVIVLTRIFSAVPSDEFKVILNKYKNIILATYGFNFKRQNPTGIGFYIDDFDSDSVEAAKIEFKSKTKINALLLKEMRLKANELNSVSKDKILLTFNSKNILLNPNLYSNVKTEKLGLDEKGNELLERIKNNISQKHQCEESDVITLNKIILQKTYPLTTAKSMNNSISPPDTSYMAKYALNSENDSNDHLSFTDMFPLSKMITDNCDNVGLSNYPSINGYIEDVPIVIKVRDKIYPALSLAAFVSYLGYSIKDINVTLNDIFIGDKKIKIEQFGTIKPVFTKPEQKYKSYTFNQILDNKINKNTLKDKIVIIAYTSVEPIAYRKTVAAQNVRSFDVLSDTINSLYVNWENK